MPKTTPTRGKRKPARCPDTGRSLKSFVEIAEDFSHQEVAVLVSGTLEERAPTFLRRQERALSPGTWDFTIAEDPRVKEEPKVEPKKLESP
jgi:hypothetical protein